MLKWEDYFIQENHILKMRTQPKQITVFSGITINTLILVPLHNTDDHTFHHLPYRSTHQQQYQQDKYLENGNPNETKVTVFS